MFLLPDRIYFVAFAFASVFDCGWWQWPDWSPFPGQINPQRISADSRQLFSADTYYAARCMFLCSLLYTSAAASSYSLYSRHTNSANTPCILLCSRLSTSAYRPCIFLCLKLSTSGHTPVCRPSCTRGGRRSPGLRPCVFQGIDSAALHG